MQDTLRLSVGAPEDVPSHVTARPAKHALQLVLLQYRVLWDGRNRLGLS